MNTLYDFLLAGELKKAELESCRLRFLVLGILSAGFWSGGNLLWAIVLCLLMILNLLYMLKTAGGGAHLPPTLLVFMETALVTLGLIYIKVGMASSLNLLYLVILYSASLRLKDSLILLAGILTVGAMNLFYTYSLIGSGDELPGNIFQWPGFSNQMVITLILLVFTLTLLSRPHFIKGILDNQQRYFDSVNSENYSIKESMGEFSREYGLSERETEVLGILIAGKTYRMIGTDLFISMDTVKSHVSSIYRKTASDGRQDLMRKLRNYALARTTYSD